MKALIIPILGGNNVIIYTSSIYKYEVIDDYTCMIYCYTPEGFETYEYPENARNLLLRIHDINPDDDYFEIIDLPQPEGPEPVAGPLIPSWDNLHDEEIPDQNKELKKKKRGKKD